MESNGDVVMDLLTGFTIGREPTIHEDRDKHQFASASVRKSRLEGT